VAWSSDWPEEFHVINDLQTVKEHSLIPRIRLRVYHSARFIMFHNLVEMVDDLCGN
jgi:hypothetical protein